MKLNEHERNPFAALQLFIGVSSTQLDTALPHQIRIWMNVIDRKLARERNRGRSHHCRYDLNKHLALASAQRFLLAKLQ